MARAACERIGAGAVELPHHLPRAKRVIYLFMHGGPSQIDLFDYKPQLKDWHGEELPPSVQGDQRLTGMTSSQKTKPLVASKFRFAQHGDERGLDERAVAAFGKRRR